MTRAATIAQMTIRVSGVLLILLGLAIWTGRADQVVPIHELLGFVLVLALWTLSFLAAPILGLTQQNLVTGDWHWTIQVLHLLIGAGAIGQGENLALRMRQLGSPRVT